MIYLENNNGTQQIFIPKNLNISIGKTYDEGFQDGIQYQKDKMTVLNVTENGVYENENGYKRVNVEVPNNGGTPSTCRIGRLEGEIGVNQDGYVVQYASDYGVDGWDYVAIDVSQYGERKYNEGINQATSKFIVPDGLSFGNSSIDLIPSNFDFSQVTEFGSMFLSCRNLKSVDIDTSKAVRLSYMFGYCDSLETINGINSSNIKSMEAMKWMFVGCSRLQNIPILDLSNVIYYTPYDLFGTDTMDALTDFGGFINLKSRMDGENSFNRCPYLTYDSCMNIINGLYDFTGNGETPTDEQGIIRIHQNFADAVGESINIITQKGWQYIVGDM